MLFISIALNFVVLYLYTWMDANIVIVVVAVVDGIGNYIEG